MLTREPSSTKIFATRPGSFAASSERTGETNSPVATIVSPLTVATGVAAGVAAADVVAGAADSPAVEVVAAALTAWTSDGSGGASFASGA